MLKVPIVCIIQFRRLFINLIFQEIFATDITAKNNVRIISFETFETKNCKEDLECMELTYIFGFFQTFPDLPLRYILFSHGKFLDCSLLWLSPLAPDYTFFLSNLIA